METCVYVCVEEVVFPRLSNNADGKVCSLFMYQQVFFGLAILFSITYRYRQNCVDWTSKDIQSVNRACEIEWNVHTTHSYCWPEIIYAYGLHTVCNFIDSTAWFILCYRRPCWHKTNRFIFLNFAITERAYIFGEDVPQESPHYWCVCDALCPAFYTVFFPAILETAWCWWAYLTLNMSADGHPTDPKHHFSAIAT